MKTGYAKFAPLYNAQEFAWDIPPQVASPKHTRIIGPSGAQSGLVSFYPIPAQVGTPNPDDILGQAGVTGYAGGLTISGI